MSPEAATTEKKEVSKARTRNNLIMLLALVPALWFAFRYFNDFAAWATSTDPSQIADLGPEILQPLFVVLMYVTVLASFSLLLAIFFERQFKEYAWGPHSRVAVLFLAFFLGAVVICNGML